MVRESVTVVLGKRDREESSGAGETSSIVVQPPEGPVSGVSPATAALVADAAAHTPVGVDLASQLVPVVSRPTQQQPQQAMTLATAQSTQTVEVPRKRARGGPTTVVYKGVQSLVCGVDQFLTFIHLPGRGSAVGGG